MLTYEYKRKSGDGLVFAYYPEGNTKFPGEVIVTDKGIGKVLSESEEDFGKRYAFHAIKGIDTKKETGTIAWY